MDHAAHRAVVRAALRQDFATFIAKVFQTVSLGDVYERNWHIDALAHMLYQVHCGKKRRLIITQPPRSLQVNLHVGRLCRLGVRPQSKHALCLRVLFP